MRQLFLISILILNYYVNAQYYKDSVFHLIKSLVNSNTSVVRTKNLDSAAALHANYLIANKTSGHFEPEYKSTNRPMQRAEKFGDWGMGIYEVCWSGIPSNLTPNTIEGSINLFKNSEKHWYIMTKAVSNHTMIRFGYSFIQTQDWVACVIIYSTGPQVKPK